MNTIKSHIKKYIVRYFAVYTVVVMVLGARLMATNTGDSMRSWWHGLGKTNVVRSEYVHKVTEEDKEKVAIRMRPAFADFVSSAVDSVYYYESKTKADGIRESYEAKYNVEIDRSTDMFNAMLGSEDAQEHVKVITKLRASGVIGNK